MNRRNLPYLLFGAALLSVGSAAVLPGSARAADEKPYKVENGRVNINTFHGYLFYGESCLRCHGPDGSGSSYAPSLVDSLKTLSKRQFQETVING